MVSGTVTGDLRSLQSRHSSAYSNNGIMPRPTRLVRPDLLTHHPADGLFSGHGVTTVMSRHA